MATMSPTWSIFTAAVVLAVQLCAGEKSCSIWSTAGSVVQRGSSFGVYCTFNCKCQGSMYSDHPPTPQSHKVFNGTTIYLNVVNITKEQTYSCECSCPAVLDPCGLDILVGYPPDRPENISCIYKVLSNESGIVFCTWDRGRDTYLRNSSVLWVRTVSGNHTGESVTYSVSRKGSNPPSASFSVSSSVQMITVWVQAENPLGSSVSFTINYTLSAIAMPSTPDLGQPDCSSRECIIQVKQPVRTPLLEIQYRTQAQMWTSYPDSGVQRSSAQGQSVSCLDPFSLYHFRARSKFSTGLWSQWSTSVSSWTQEEAPAKEVDVWYAEAASDLKWLRVYWKEVNISFARGKIIGYKVGVHSQKSGLLFSNNTNADARSYSVPFCGDCEVTVWAYNSKGPSPPARITTRHTKAKPLMVVQETAVNHGVTISWRNSETATGHTAYVVEWFPVGHKLEELRWARLGRNVNHTVITGIMPYECYEGAVSVVFADSSVSRSSFKGVSTLETAPAAGPSVQEKVEGNDVKVTWIEIPRGQRGGCIASYTIYLENSSEKQQKYSVPASEKMHVLKDVSPDAYRLWMTASTATGEGPPGQKVLFIQSDTHLSVLVCVGISLIVLILLCLCQNSAVKQRFWVFFQCLMLDAVPDPANSKWAKECVQEKGKMKLHLQLSNSSVTDDEEEPILVDVEELPKQSSGICTPADDSSNLPTTVLHPPTTYIKSFSSDSDSSDHTQTSQDTSKTVDYISSHGLEIMDEEDQEEEDEEFIEMTGFFPSHNIFIEPLQFGGKLTLDAVKINGGDFFSEQFFEKDD